VSCVVVVGEVIRRTGVVGGLAVGVVGVIGVAGVIVVDIVVAPTSSALVYLLNNSIVWLVP